MYADWITISATGSTFHNIGFRPEFIRFDAHPAVDAMDVDKPSDSTGSHVSNFTGPMTGYGVRQPDGTVNNFSMNPGISGDSVNQVSLYSSSQYSVGIRYAGRDGGLLGRTLAYVSDITENGFELTVDQVDRNQLVFYWVMGV